MPKFTTEYTEFNGVRREKTQGFSLCPLRLSRTNSRVFVKECARPV